jgi:hypothetical protein
MFVRNADLGLFVYPELNLWFEVLGRHISSLEPHVEPATGAEVWLVVLHVKKVSLCGQQ